MELEYDLGIRYCRRCGRVFGPCWDNRRYCSDTCRDAGYYEKQLAANRRARKRCKEVSQPEEEPARNLNPMLKIDPRKLPYRGEPTRRSHAELPEDRELRAIWEARKRSEACRERFINQKRDNRARENWENNPKRWTPEKDADLMRMYHAGMDLKEISQKTGRTFLAVESRIRTLKNREEMNARTT